MILFSFIHENHTVLYPRMKLLHCTHSNSDHAFQNAESQPQGCLVGEGGGGGGRE